MTPKCKKNYIILLLVVFFSCFNIASASVSINEVQLNPTEERFIELYNSGSSSVDLTDWYIQRKTATGSTFGSLISKTYFNGKSIDAGGYFVISKSDIANSDIVYSGLTLTESNTIQLKNSNQELMDKFGWGSVNDCGSICAPNPTDGKSIQKVSGGDWIISSHTPGTSNSGVSNNFSSDTSSESSNVAYTEDNIQTNDSVPLKITTKIISTKIVVAGIPFSVSSLTTTNKGETYAVGRFVWNFGDGSKNEINNTCPFEHIYEYPGDYVLSLSYFSTIFSQTADAIDKINIKVIPADIYISSVGSYFDPYVELENKSKYDITLSNWIITAGMHYFIIPEGTTLLQGKKIKLSPKITGFMGEDIKYVIITNPNKETIATYPEQKKMSVKSISVNNKITNNNSNQSNDFKDDSSSNNLEVINLNDLSASAGNTKSDVSNSAYPFIGLLVILGLGVTSFLFMKKKKDVEDYVEKEIRPEDMTIIE